LSGWNIENTHREKSLTEWLSRVKRGGKVPGIRFEKRLGSTFIG